MQPLYITKHKIDNNLKPHTSDILEDLDNGYDQVLKLATKDQITDLLKDDSISETTYNRWLQVNKLIG
jgi:hypothetical protein